MLGPPSGFRGRIFLALTLVSLVPVVLTLFFGTAMLREVVSSTGSAGAWDEVAESGRALFEQLATVGSPSAELSAAAERHEAALAESVRFSRLYAFLGERVLVLLPAFALLILALVAGLALVAANSISRDFSRPVEELVSWTRALSAGDELPAPEPKRERRGIREFAVLREALRATSTELGRARRREVEQAKMQSWADMARMVAHELKNPLTPMAMAADRVARSTDGNVAAAGEVLKAEIQRLDELARSFAQFGRPPSGPMSAVDLGELLTSLAAQLSAQGMMLSVDVPEHAVLSNGDLGSLERVFRNLVSNAQESVDASRATHAAAALATDSGVTAAATVGHDAPVHVELTSFPSWAEVRVQDRGTGIPDDMLQRIWEPDFTRKRRGTGLGLAFVRQVVQAHGGEAMARNRAGGGAEIIIRLPRTEA
jgi:nitrogen fixation/metabolism regulation signal transduction histidine kinase